MPFRENSQHVAYYEDGPRYEDKYQIYVGVGPTFTACRITYLPIAEFVEPLGYSVQQKGDTVFICE